MPSGGGGVHSVEFYAPTSTVDAAGQDTVIYRKAFRASVAFMVLRETKTDAGMIQQSGRQQARVFMPYNPSVKVSWRFVHEDVTYDIDGVRDPNGRRSDLEVTGTAVEL